MVVAPHRDGGQAQFIAPATPRPSSSGLGPVLEWAVRNLRVASVRALAARSGYSPRQFARVLERETGTTPLAWLTHQRVTEARRLLEETDLTMDAVAETVGLGSAAALRRAFRATLDLSPTHYRQTFRRSAPLTPPS